MTTVETIRKQLEELLPSSSHVTNSLLVELPEPSHVTSPSPVTTATILYSSFDDLATASKYAQLAVRHVISAKELAQLSGETPQLLRVRSADQEIFILPSSDKYILLAIAEVK